MIAKVRTRARDFVYRHVGGTALVLVYHRVADLQRDPQRLAVAVHNFSAQIRLLSQRYRVVSLEELIRTLRKRRVLDRAIAITFDDGYADNLHNAAPVLAGREVPATVFVGSGAIGTQREFWWDEVERIVLAPGTLSDHIELAVGHARFSAAVTGSRVYSPADAARDAIWNIESANDNERQRLYRNLCAFIKPLSSEERASALEQLRAAADAPAPRTGYLPLSATELAALDAYPAIDIGAHTVSHQMLSVCAPEEQREEIRADRDALLEMLGHTPRVFAYPYGGLDDYTAETAEIVREVGYEGACSGHPGVVKMWGDPYRIPRHLVRDWDAETLVRKIDGWFDGQR